jgi:hypothetical protein
VTTRDEAQSFDGLAEQYDSTGEWLDHRASDRYLSREQFEQTYAQTFPAARSSRVGRAHGMLWDNLS